MNNSKIKHDRKQSLKIINNCKPKRRVTFAQSVEVLQENLSSKKNISKSTNDKKSQRRKISKTKKIPSEECKIVNSTKNVSQDKIPYSDKHKSKLFNKLNSNKSLQAFKENEKENRNLKVNKNLSFNNYILYDKNCEKKISFKDGLQNFIINEHRRSVCNILSRNKKSKDINPKRRSVFNINSKKLDETKTNYPSPSKHTSNSLTKINPNTSSEEDFQKIKKKYLSPFIYSNNFPKVTLKNKYFNNYIINTTNKKSNKETLDNEISSLKKINAKKINIEPNSEEETTEYIQKNESMFDNHFNKSNYISSSIKDLFNESINRCYGNIINTIDHKINEIKRNKNYSSDTKKYNNKLKTCNGNLSQRELINKINTIKVLNVGKKDYFSKVFNNYNISERTYGIISKKYNFY